MLLDLTKCPCCGVIFDYKLSTVRNDNTPSADRFDSNKGYTKDNVRFICWRCNKSKNDASLEDLKIIRNWLKNKI